MKVIFWFLNFIFFVLFSTAAAAAISMQGLKIKGNQIFNGNNQQIRFLGASRSGSEFMCIQGRGFFDGPVDAKAIAAIQSWNINLLRIPLNEDCWLGGSSVPANATAFAGAAYRSAIGSFVKRLTAANMAVLLELHWSAPNNQTASGQQPMPDVTNSVPFWTSVATQFKSYSNVIFGLFNEPYPDNNSAFSITAWRCWQNGGTDCPSLPYNAAGMQLLVNTVRHAAATNIISVSGVNYANSLASFASHAPVDPLRQLMASWHSYSNGLCSVRVCWDFYVASLAKVLPVMATEIGEFDCADVYIKPLMTWLDAHNLSYAAWTWNTWNCKLGPSLISKYDGTPTSYGAGYKAHLQSLPQ